MKKKLVSTIMVVGLLVSFAIPFLAIERENADVVEEEATETIKSPETSEEAFVVKREDAMVMMAIEEMSAKMTKLDEVKDKEEWFISYKEIVNEYSYILDPPETIYDYYTKDEIDKLFAVVQAEVGDEYSFEQKCNVASVIFNRVYCNEDSFAKQNTLSDVLTSDQFGTIKDGRYKTVEVSETTRLACEYVFMFGSTTEALFFDSDGSLNYKWIENDGAHNFYTLRKVV